MGNEPLGWKLVRFTEVVDKWITRESPSDDMRVVVLDWIMSRHEDPYRGMRREPAVPNLWFGAVAGSQSGWTVVTCSYFIYERTKIISCNDICTLNQPI